MDTDRLRYFWTVSQTANIHRASELLGISPAALSKSMKLLERELELKLVIPSGRGIAITDEGKALATKIEKVLADIDALRAQAAPAESAAAPLRVGSFEVFTTHALGPLVRDHFPDGSLVVHELLPGRLEEAIADRLIDVGVTYLPIARPEIDFLKVTTIRMGVFGKKNLWARGEKVTEIPFVVPVAPLHGAPTKVVGLDGWPDTLVRRHIPYRVTLMESALELCRQGLAAAFLPDFVVELHNAKVREPFVLTRYPSSLPLQTKHVEQPVYLVKRRADLEVLAHKKLAKALRLICR